MMERKFVLMLVVVCLMANSAIAAVYTIEIDEPPLSDGTPIPDGHGAVAGVFDTYYYGDGSLDVDLHVGYDLLDGGDGATSGEGVGSGNFNYVELKFAPGLYPAAASFEIGRWGGASAGKSIDAGFVVRDSAGSTVVYTQTNLLDISSGLITVTADASTLAAMAANPGGYLDFMWDGDGWYATDNFTINFAPPGAATDPTPAVGAPLVGIDQNLSWVAPEETTGTGPVTYEVYYSTDSNDLGTAHIPTNGGQDTFLDPPTDFAYGTEYFWRVDVTDPNDGDPVTTTGVLWSFTTAQAVLDPALTYPLAADDPDADLTMTWTADPATTATRVYISNAGFPLQLDATLTTETSYHPADLEWGKAYDWRIETDAPGGTTSATGTFTVHTLTCSPVIAGVIAALGTTDDCIFDLEDFAALAALWIDCGIDRDLGNCDWPYVAQGFGLEASAELWVRQSDPNTSYEADWISIRSFNNTTEPDNVRYGLVEFDLSSYQGQTATGATLYLYQESSSSSPYPIVQIGYQLSDDPADIAFTSLTYSTYISDKEPVLAAFETFGAYSLAADESMDSYIGSAASEADLAIIQSIIDAGGKLQMVLKADPAQVDEMRVDWGDAESTGNPPRLDIQF